MLSTIILIAILAFLATWIYVDAFRNRAERPIGSAILIGLLFVAVGLGRLWELVTGKRIRFRHVGVASPRQAREHLAESQARRDSALKTPLTFPDYPLPDERAKAPIVRGDEAR